MKIFQIFEKFGEILPPDQQVDQTGFNECSTEESGGGQLQKQVENILEILTINCFFILTHCVQTLCCWRDGSRGRPLLSGSFLPDLWPVALSTGPDEGG